MTIPTCPPLWRAAALRGLWHGDQGDEALVALCAEQVLRVPLPTGCTTALHARLGRRIWVDMRSGALRLDDEAGGSHV